MLLGFPMLAPDLEYEAGAIISFQKVRAFSEKWEALVFSG